VGGANATFRLLVQLILTIFFWGFCRCHTLAFVPSKGRIYAFGLGGSGQLGTKSTANVNSPQLVIGPWETSNNSIKDVKDLATETAEALSTIQSKRVVVRNIFCGGDQSFSLVCPYTVRLFLKDFCFKF
jgi:E3 ubiquitin-protein ligase HERC4